MLKNAIKESIILRYCLALDKNILSAFYQSTAYRITSGTCRFVKSCLNVSIHGSVIVNYSKKLCNIYTLNDGGLFIILAVIFNTVLMLYLGKSIDIFSAIGRILLCVIGLTLLLKRR